MTTPFHPLDVEAAAKAIEEEFGKQQIAVMSGVMSVDAAVHQLVQTALTAAIASAKARGAAREAGAYFDLDGPNEVDAKTSYPLGPGSAAFPVLIIRMEE